MDQIHIIESTDKKVEGEVNEWLELTAAKVTIVDIKFLDARSVMIHYRRKDKKPVS